MVKFLNAFSLKAKGFDLEKINYLEALFNSFLNSASTLENTDFQSALKRFSITLFESIFAASCGQAFNEKRMVDGKIARQSVAELRADPEFQAAAERATTGTGNVLKRLDRARMIVKLQ